MNGEQRKTENGRLSGLVYDVRGLCFTYPGTDRQILREVSFEVMPGEIMSILGANGAGKSTLMSLMMGFLQADSGQIQIGGKPVGEMRPKEIASQVGYVPQVHEPSFDYKVEEFILMGAAPGTGMFSHPSEEDRVRCRELMQEMNISHLAGRSYLRISGGERQQALIARAVMQDPQVILFDEPTAHLDYGNTYRTLKMVRAMADKGYAVVITTHDPNQALLLDGKAGIIDSRGCMRSGRTDEMITEENLSQIYDCNLRLIEIPEMERTACITPNL